VKKRITAIILCLLCMNFNFNLLPAKAYTDLSSYKVETGSFESENAAQASLTSFKNKTGWSGVIEETEKTQNYYQVYSGGFVGVDRAKEILEDFKYSTKVNANIGGVGQLERYYELLSGGFRDEAQVKSILQDFKSSTGINANYIGAGELEKYYEVLTGGFIGEDYVKAILQDFKSSTGINATYEGFGDKVKYYEIISGGFIGEERAQQVLKDFKSSTGIDAKYEGVGAPQKYYTVLSGGFKGKDRVAQVLKEFTAVTGFPASYIYVGNNTYKVKTAPILATSLKKAEDFFRSHNWWYSSTPTGKEGYERFQIKSVPIQGIQKANTGLNFFVKNNWYAKSSETEITGFERFRIKTDPILGTTLLAKAQNFFTKNNWYISTRTTGQQANSVYKIKTEPLLGSEQVLKAKGFFDKNKWYANISQTGKSGYKSYRIVTEPIAGLETVNKATEFFKKNDWYVTFLSTGQQASIYQIVTEEFNGYDNAIAAADKIKSLFGWNTELVKTKTGPQLMYTDYGLSLISMLEKQMAKYPQTDKYRNQPRYVHADFVDMNKQIITGDGVNLRTSPTLGGTVVQQLNTGDGIIIIGKTGDWVEVRLTWQNAFASDVQYHLDPNNFSLYNKDYFQFLKLSQPANLNAYEVNEKILNGKGILAGKGQAFIDAANKYNINDVYLISHALLETGNGTSTLANGVMVNGKTVYNMFGYGAADSCPITCGAKTAYDNGWFTPEAAIIGGAQFISSDYIYNSTFYQDTLYKMRWNPVQTWHQYATDIGWAYKQVDNIYNLYQMLDNYTLYYDIPKYR
jgi:mannosyl-glycoprotein endo-beta-N-acetylglucosaminidase